MTVRSGQGRRFCAVLGVLGLLAQAWVPLVHHAPRAASDLWLAGAICHVGGADRPAAPGDPAKSGPRKAPFCPICFALQLGGAFLLPILGVLLLARSALAVAARSLASTRFTAVGYILAQPRGPPLPA